MTALADLLVHWGRRLSAVEDAVGRLLEDTHLSPEERRELKAALHRAKNTD